MTEQHGQKDSSAGWSALKIAAIYALAGGVWIVTTSSLLPRLLPEVTLQQLSRWETYKGWVFVGATAVVLYFLVHRKLAELIRSQAALRAGEVRYRQLVETAEEGEAKYRALVEESLVGVYIIQDGRFVYVNPRLAEIFGYSQGEMIGGMGPTDVTDPDARAMVMENLRRRIEGEVQSIHYAFEGLRRDGTVIDVEVLGLRAMYRGRAAVIGTLLDMTDRKKAERELKESEARFRKIFEEAPVGVVLTGLDNRIVRANGAFVRMLGYSEQELAGLTWMELTHPQDLGLSMPLVAQLHAGEVPFYRLEKRYLAKDGSIKWGAVMVSMIRLEPQRPLYHLVMIEDITERKWLEQQLIQSQKMEAIGRLAGGVAHDFNNLLAVISGYSESLLRRLPAEDALVNHVEEIAKAAERGASLTRQLLAFSRRQTIQPQVLDLNVIVRDLEEMLRRVIGRKIEVEVALSGQAGRIRADRGQMEQVIVNLALNARDAMSDGGKLSISTADVVLEEGAESIRYGLAEGRYVKLVVCDTGCGMEQEVQARIFEPFFTTKEGKGTGLGLSIVYGIVQQAGGSVYVRSAPQEGSTFEVLLPCVESESGGKIERKETASCGSGPLLSH